MPEPAKSQAEKSKALSTSRMSKKIRRSRMSRRPKAPKLWLRATSTSRDRPTTMVLTHRRLRDAGWPPSGARSLRSGADAPHAGQHRQDAEHIKYLLDSGSLKDLAELKTTEIGALAHTGRILNDPQKEEYRCCDKELVKTTSSSASAVARDPDAS